MFERFSWLLQVDALEGLRHTLRVKTRMVYFKNKNVRGQRAGTRSRSIIDRVHKRALAFVAKYRVAREAKLQLSGPGKWEERLRPLLDKDVRSYVNPEKKGKGSGRCGIWEDGQAPPGQRSATTGSIDDEEDSEEEDKAIDALPTTLPCKEGTGETRKTISWIWLNTNIIITKGPKKSDNDILRAEWARSRAQVKRATEEVELVREEMRRTLAFLEWRAAWWDERKKARQGVLEDLQEGIIAYAADQARIQRALATKFLATWKVPMERADAQDDSDDEDDDEEVAESGMPDS